MLFHVFLVTKMSLKVFNYCLITLKNSLLLFHVSILNVYGSGVYFLNHTYGCKVTLLALELVKVGEQVIFLMMFTCRSWDSIRFDMLYVCTLRKFCASCNHVCLNLFSRNNEIRSSIDFTCILVEPRETSVSGIIITLHLAKLLLCFGSLHRVHCSGPRGCIHEIIPTVHSWNWFSNDFTLSTAHQGSHLSWALCLITHRNTNLCSKTDMTLLKFYLAGVNRLSLWLYRIINVHVSTMIQCRFLTLS